MKQLLLLGLASGALASLNCTLTKELKTYCCPDASSEVVKTSPVDTMIQIGCAADNMDRTWFWNYNGLYTPFTPDLKDCNLGGIAFPDIKVLPDCAVDAVVLNLTRHGSGPLDKCNAKCVSNNKLPRSTYFGDKQKESNKITDFPPVVLRPRPAPAAPAQSSSAPAAPSPPPSPPAKGMPPPPPVSSPTAPVVPGVSPNPPGTAPPIVSGPIPPLPSGPVPPASPPVSLPSPTVPPSAKGAPPPPPVVAPPAVPIIPTGGTMPQPTTPPPPPTKGKGMPRRRNVYGGDE